MFTLAISCLTTSRWWNSSWAISNPKRWCCESATLNKPANLENSAVATGLENVSFHSNPKERQCPKCSNYCKILLISHASKVILKILQAGFSNMWTMNFQMFKLVLEKAEEPEIRLPTSPGSSKKEESSRKNIYFCFIDYAKVFYCVDHYKLENFERREYRPPGLPLEKPVCRSGSNS